MAKKEVVVLVGAGSIGQAIARRVRAGKHVVLADISQKNAEAAAKTLEEAGFDTSVLVVDLSSRASIIELVQHAQSHGTVMQLINAAGVSPSQASVETILKVDLYGTAVLLEEFGKVIGEGGSGIVISSQSGHRLGNIPPEESEQLAITPTEALLSLPLIQGIEIPLKPTNTPSAAMCCGLCMRRRPGASVEPLSIRSARVSSSRRWPTMN